MAKNSVASEIFCSKIWFGLVLVACLATSMVIYSRLIKPPGRTAEIIIVKHGHYSMR